MGAILLLEDGRRFEGDAFGAAATRVGEIVFHTAMTGYQEILTDPSFAEQVVVMTSPHIGNTGVNDEDPESDRIWASGLVVRRLSRAPSNFRSQGGLHQYLKQRGIPGIQGIDTRALVRHIRTRGAMKCAISTDGTPLDALREQVDSWPGMVGRDLASEVCCEQPYTFAEPDEPRLRFTVIDGGVKKNILRLLAQAGHAVRVVPITAPVETWVDGADALMFGNGPGDPDANPEIVAKVKRAIELRPSVGICLGHQLLALAAGAKTYKLPFGHRGGNQPVRDESGRVAITSQNHGFAVERASLEATGAVVTHVHLNDQTVSGFRHEERGLYAVQFHPEDCPGPHDGRYLIEDFTNFVEPRCR